MYRKDPFIYFATGLLLHSNMYQIDGFSTPAKLIYSRISVKKKALSKTGLITSIESVKPAAPIIYN